MSLEAYVRRDEELERYPLFLISFHAAVTVRRDERYEGNLCPNTLV